MDWNDFAKRLTLELSRLPVTSFLIVQGPSGLPYVQAMRAEGVLDAEAVSSEFLPRPLASRQERRLRALGWEPPDEEERKNWWHQFLLRDRGGARASAEQLEACALLAGLMVGAFRDVYRVESPLELVYQASRSGPEGGPLALPGLGIPLAVPDADARPDARPARPAGSTLETALAEARERGDQHGYLDLLARAVLYLPAPGDPGAAEHQFATAQFGDGTFVLAFTSPEAMDRSLQGQAIHHRQASLSELSRHWPHPDWQLAVNPGLPSASYLDATALFEPEEPRKPADPAPPAPTDVRVAGASSRTGTRGGSTGDRRAPRRPESSAPPRTESPAPSDLPAASQEPTRPPVDSSAPRAAAPPPTRRPEAPAAPAARETVGDPRGIPVLGHGGSAKPSRETPSDPQGLPVAPAYGRREATETVSRHHTVPAGPQSTAPNATAPAQSPNPPPNPVPRPAQSPPQSPPPNPVPRPAQSPPPNPVPRPAKSPPQGPPSGVPGKSAAAQATPVYTQNRTSAPQSGVRDTRTDPVAPHAGSGAGMDAPTRPQNAPGGRGRERRIPTQDVPVAGRESGGAAEKRKAPAKDPGQKGQAPPDGASPVVVMQKVVRPEHVQHYLEGGYDLVAGYVHRFKDVREMTTPGALIRCLGLVYEGSPFTPADEEIHAIRWPAVKPPLFRRPLGGIDEWSMGIIPGGWVIEKAPFPGSGYAPGEGPAIPEFKIESQRLPHGAEMYRLTANGREALVASYDADLRRWLLKQQERPGGRA